MNTTNNICGDDNITIFNKGHIYIINKEPYETIGDVYKRGWYIINNIKTDNYDKSDKSDNYTKLYSLSIINNNKNKGMTYDNAIL
jgi:hypothetical protein